jgi:hypothetical protein
MENLSTIVAVIVALSVASERLVEIIKSFSEWLNTKQKDDFAEGKRTAAIQAIAVGASIVTAFACWPLLTKFVPVTYSSIPVVLALGLLASGGSGFWNSIQTYVLGLKDVQAATAAAVRKTPEIVDRSLSSWQLPKITKIA